MNIFSLVGWAAWIILIIVMLARPLSILFKGIFIKILPYRKWLGISLSFLIIVHLIIFASRRDYDFSFFIDPNYWDFTGLLGWGLLAFVLMIPLFVTSNKFSMQILGKNWKRLQRLAYLFFIAVGIHIYFAGHPWYFTLLPIGLWAALYAIALIKRKKESS
jgi:sulfoxide reductase heme-binding subunit YedZ